MKNLLFFTILVLNFNIFAQNIISKQIKEGNSHLVSLGNCQIKDKSIPPARQSIILETTSCKESIVADFKVSDRIIFGVKVGTIEEEIPGTRRINNQLIKEIQTFERTKSFMRSNLTSELLLNNLNEDVLMLKCSKMKDDLEKEILSIYQTNCKK